VRKIIIKNKIIRTSFQYLGWSGRGWPDGGQAAAGPISSQAPSWDSYSQEIGINMVRIGFSIKHFLPEDTYISSSLADYIKKGFDNKEASWAKSAKTSYAYLLQRCHDLGWKILICLNPSYGSRWNPLSLIQTSNNLQIWRKFCFHLSKFIENNWPREALYFEITNEPDLGYFDGESLLPGYHGPAGGLTPSQYCLLLEQAFYGLKEAIPEAKIIGPSLASWDRNWLEKILVQGHSYLDGISYHNVAGNLTDEVASSEAKKLIILYAPQIRNTIFNSEWAWWPNHDINHEATALRIAHILYLQAKGSIYGSFYLGPAQPKGFKKGLGVIHFHVSDPNQVERTKTFFAFRLMARGLLGGNFVEVLKSPQRLKILALLKDNQELVVTFINTSRKKFKNLSIELDKTFPVSPERFIKCNRFYNSHFDAQEKIRLSHIRRFSIPPKSLLQFSIPFS